MTTSLRPKSSRNLPIQDAPAPEAVPDDSAGERTLRRNLFDSMGALPWWLISATVHIVFIFLSMVIVVGSSRSLLPDIELVKVDLTPPPPEKKKEDIKVELTKKVQVNLETKSDQVFYTPEKVEVTEQVETENEVQSEMPARGQEDAISTIPAEGRGAIGFFGVGGGGKAGAFGWRMGGGRKNRALKNGGSNESESSVDLGLEWLARNQEPQGHWDALKHGSTYTQGDASSKATEGVSGLALLAFLGAGHTDKHGKYKEHVKRGQQWLIDQQKPNGYLGTPGDDPAGYGHAILGLAAAEGFGMSQNKSLQQTAQKAIDYTCNEHQCMDGNEYSAWRYKAKMEPDTSVTGWFVMQLKSAKVAGLTVPGHSFIGAMNWLNKVQPIPDKATGYEDGGKARYKPDARPEPRITAVALLARLFLGQKTNEPVMQGAANYIMNNPPPVSTEAVDFYYLYYGTLSIFQMGGGRWAQWNEHMRNPLIALQIQAPGPDLGSWNPTPGNVANGGRWNELGGRVWSTAAAVLCLEVYYRYLPMYRE